MPDRTRERRDAPRPPTVLDPLRPAVVRRRVVDPATFNANKHDDAGPPSSVNVARALASLRADELRRVETLVSLDDDDELDDDGVSSVRVAPTSSPSSSSARDDDEEPPPTAVSPGSNRAADVPATPTVLLGNTIVLSALAQQMGKPAEELVGTLVASGFYSLHAKSTLSKETATTIATMFGFKVDDAPVSEPAAKSSKRGTSKPASKKPKKKTAKKTASKR